MDRAVLLSLPIALLVYSVCNDAMLSLGLTPISCCLIVIVRGRRKLMDAFLPVEKRWSSRMLLVYPIFHILSLFSSSFIEEEHQTWYYLLSTFLLLRSFEEKSTKMLFLLILSRVARSWNQTGNKWLNLPDTGDFLNA